MPHPLLHHQVDHASRPVWEFKFTPPHQERGRAPETFSRTLMTTSSAGPQSPRHPCSCLASVVQQHLQPAPQHHHCKQGGHSECQGQWCCTQCFVLDACGGQICDTNGSVYGSAEHCQANMVMMVVVAEQNPPQRPWTRHCRCALDQIEFAHTCQRTCPHTKTICCAKPAEGKAVTR